MSLGPGYSFGPYRVMEPLGRGGMASVFKAYEAGLDRYVALKVLPAEFLHDPTFAERFRREAKVVARLEHPNIIPIYAFDIEKGVPWMAMRLIPGGSLSAALKSGPLSPEKTVSVLRGVAAALAYAHEKGVVHRDVKPQNILLDEAGRVYLADFGIARMLEGSAALTQTGMITGTPQYMAPEQATAGTPDHRADIYALGIVAYEMLTGRVPFSADTPVAVLLKHCTDPMPLPDRALVPDAVVRPLLKCTSKKPEDRWPSATAFVDALEHGFSEARAGRSTTTLAAPASQPTVVTTIPARPSSTVVPQQPATMAGPAPAASRRGLVVAAAAVLVLALGAGAAALLLSRRDSASPGADAGSASPAALPGEVEQGAQPEAGGASPPSEPAALPPSSPFLAVETPAASVDRPLPGAASAARTAQARQPASSPGATSVAAARPANPPPRPVEEAPARVAAPEPPAPPASLQLDVDASQDPHSGTAVDVLYLQVLVDGKPMRDLVLRFDTKNAFTRSRKRQLFEVTGVPSGERRLVVRVSDDAGMANRMAEGESRISVPAEGARLNVLVRERTGGEREVRIR